AQGANGSAATSIGARGARRRGERSARFPRPRALPRGRRRSAPARPRRTRRARPGCPARPVRSEAPGPPAPTPPAGRAAGEEPRPVSPRRSSCLHLSRPAWGLISSLETLTELAEAARDPARDRPGRDPELLADRPVALVAAEEAVEHLLALLRELAERLAHGERLVEVLHRLLDAGRLEIGRLVTARRGQPAR